jgi:hypothetical protein
MAEAPGAKAVVEEFLARQREMPPLGGREVVWRTAGVYRVADGRIAEAWLVPLDQEHFDRIWAATRPTPFVYIQRVRPQECAVSTMLGLAKSAGFNLREIGQFVSGFS